MNRNQGRRRGVQSSASTRAFVHLWGVEQRPKWELNISAMTGRRSISVSAGPACCQPWHRHQRSLSPTGAGVERGAARRRGPRVQLQGAGAWWPGGSQPRPVSARHGPAVVQCALRRGAAAAGTSSGAGGCSISRGERAVCHSHGRKAPFWAVSSTPGWKAPPELVLQVSSFRLVWETDFFHAREIQAGSKPLRIPFMHRSVQAWPFMVLL